MSQGTTGTQTAVIPTGAVQMYAGSSAPGGWLFCDGAAVSRTTYAALFAVLETTYGAGNGSTTFNLPDFRGRSPLGVGTGAQNGGSGTGVISGGTALTARSLGAWAGAETHTLTAAESGLPSHSHANQYFAGAYSSGSVYFGFVPSVASYYSAPGVQAITAGPTDASNSHNNMQPYLTLNFIIKT